MRKALPARSVGTVAAIMTVAGTSSTIHRATSHQLVRVFSAGRIRSLYARSEGADGHDGATDECDPVSPELRRTERTVSALGAVRNRMVETMGLEPTTPCLQSRCSSQLSYVPGVTTGYR